MLNLIQEEASPTYIVHSYLVEVCNFLTNSPEFLGVLCILGPDRGSNLPAVAVVLAAMISDGLLQAAEQARLSTTFRCLH